MQNSHPDVKALAQSNFDFITKGVKPRIDKSRRSGSPNMKWLWLINAYFSDPAGYRDELIAALQAQEANGLFTYGEDSCEQGVSTPHCELYLNAFSALYLDCVRKGEEDINLTALSGRVFSGIAGLAATVSTPHNEIFMPGARQSQAGPLVTVLNSCVAVITNRITKSPFRRFDRQTCSVTFLLEATKSAKLPTAFYPKLRWPLSRQDFTDGMIVRMSVPESDAAMMGPIGSGGVGTIEVRKQHSTKKIGWKTYSGLDLGALKSNVSLGESKGGN